MVSHRTLQRTDKRLASRLIGSLVKLSLLVMMIAASLVPHSGHADSPLLKTYPLPAAPFDVEVENSSRIWFTLPTENAIGSLEVLASGTVTYTAFTLPTPNSQPYRLAISGGNVWFTQRQGNRIGRLSIADGTITEYAVATPNSEPTGIDVAPDGRVWFAQHGSDKLAVLSPSTGNISEINTNITGAEFDQVNAQTSGTLWVAAPGVNELIAYRYGTNQLIPVALDDPSGQPGTLRAFTVSTGGILRASTTNSAKIGTYVFGTLTIWQWYRYPSADADFVDILTSPAPGQTLFWGLDAYNKQVVQIGMSRMSLIHQVKIDIENSAPTAFVLDRTTGVLWIADEGASAIHAWQPPYSLKSYLPTISG